MDRAMSVHKIGEQLTASTVSGLFSGLMALLNFGLLYYYSPSLAVVAVLVACLTAALTAVSAFLIRRHAVALQELGGRFGGFQIQVVQGVAKLRVAGAEGRAYGQWMRRYAEQARLSLRIAAIEDWAFVLNLLISTTSTVALFWFGYGLLSGGEGAISIGVFLAFIAAFSAFLGGTAGVSNTLIGLFDVAAASKRLLPILDEVPESDAARKGPVRLSGRVAAERITFRYRRDGPAILDDVTVRAEPGEFVAIVGSSGSGKSTLLRLLLGFETPETGAVFYDGMDLGGVDVRSVRRQLGIVLQGGRLTQGTLLSNIATGAQVPLDQVMDAVRRSGFADDLQDLPMGIHTVVSEGGTNLSGGQRQRLLIARALVYRPKLLLFDEATSALDNRTQAIVGESLEKMNVTRLVIAHRLSTVRNADRIYVLDRGRIVESGTFDDLRDAGGLFARMMARQLA
jgi:ABC-type bacteriocin/lantibiotic exporter with double-glycine peptidase domain